jgi:hypothetical protein
MAETLLQAFAVWWIRLIKHDAELIKRILICADVDR